MRCLSCVLWIAVAGLLAACAPGPHLFVAHSVMNFAGSELGPEMVNRHLVGWVGFNEDHASRVHRQGQAQLYGQGIAEGTPEYALRYVHISMGQLKGVPLFAGDGEYPWYTGAAVPDHLPRLMAADIVEVRQVGTLRTLTNFTKTGEGNIVTRVLCRKAQSDYQACLDALSRTGKVKGVGPTGTPYPVSAKEYGFTFTPAYDDKGDLLRPLPTAKTP
jgi:hypothetical protein